MRQTIIKIPKLEPSTSGQCWRGGQGRINRRMKRREILLIVPNQAVKSVFVLSIISIFHKWNGGIPNFIRIPITINRLAQITSPSCILLII